MIYYWAVFFFLLLVSQLYRMVRIKFAMSWWAYTFPLASFTSATLLMGRLTQQEFFLLAAQGLYYITTVVVAALFIRTLWALVKCEVCVPD